VPSTINKRSTNNYQSFLFQFIHAADIHLDSPLRGLEQYEGAPVQQIRSASRRALENLVALAIQEQVRFVLIAGDLYDGDWKDYQTGLFFVKQAARLREAKIPLLIIAGNHDASNKMTRSLQLPDNVKLFSSSEPETEILKSIDVAIHGQSFAAAEVLHDLSQGYPAPIKGCFNIGLLHTSLDGREGHDSYAPCTLDRLKLKGYDYWALGHIHQREILCDDPFIAFSGNLQGRHIRETGPKGCFLVTVRGNQTVEADFRELDIMRWAKVGVDLTGVKETDESLELVAQELKCQQAQTQHLPLAVRIELHGSCGVHGHFQAQREFWTNQFRGIAIDIGQGEIWIEKVKFLTHDSAAKKRSVDDSSLGELLELFEAIRQNPRELIEIGFDFSKVSKKLPQELVDWHGDDKDWLNGVIDEAESLLMQRLLHPPTSAPVRKGGRA
jgi:DNA repair exonuclease SbcCD nuclease subunit